MSDESKSVEDKEATRFVWRLFIALGIIVVGGSFASHEQLAKWATWNLGWPKIAYYGVGMASWVIGMIVLWPRMWVPAIFGGSVAGLCGTYLAVAYLEAVDTFHTFILGLIAMVGLVPGFVVYAGVGFLLHWLNIVPLHVDDKEAEAPADEGDEPANEDAQ